MDFAGWLLEQEMLSPPDHHGIAYIGCVLDETAQSQLLHETEKFLAWYEHQDGKKGFYDEDIGIPKKFCFKAHHMTIKFGRDAHLDHFDNSLYPPFGSDVDLLVTDLAADKYCIAAVVRPQSKLPEVTSGMPHITIAHDCSVSPKYSIEMLQHAPWFSVKEPLVLRSKLLVVYHGGHFWPADPSIPLAKIDHRP